MSIHSRLTRRKALLLAIGILTATNVAGFNYFDRANAVGVKASLKKRAAAIKLIYGSSSGYHTLASDAKFAASFVQECQILVGESELKWTTLRPTPERFDFTQSDWLIRFARTHKMLVRGHTLVWHESLPSWLIAKLNHQNAKQFLVEHIQRVVGHNAGKIHSWDVVNEAIDVPDQQPFGLRKTPWLEFLGPDYIELAFRTAAKVDPQALLVYNDYGFEYDTPKDEAKRNAVLKLIKHLKSRGVPIHALGIQSHLDGSETHFNAKKFRDFLRNVAKLGLKILITELDVEDKNLPSNPVARDRIVAKVYEDYLSVVLSEKAVTSVITWGISDRHTWLADYKPRSDGAKVRTLPLDANLKPKLAWDAIGRAFDRAPKR
jgi:endo-1,4-beta-xylanase